MSGSVGVGRLQRGVVGQDHPQPGVDPRLVDRGGVGGDEGGRGEQGGEDGEGDEQEQGRGPGYEGDHHLRKLDSTVFGMEEKTRFDCRISGGVMIY